MPRVLDYKAQVVLRGKFDSFLNISWGSRVDPDYWHVPLLARDAEGGVEVAALDGPVRKRVGVFCGAGLIGAQTPLYQPARTSVQLPAAES